MFGTRLGTTPAGPVTGLHLMAHADFNSFSGFTDPGGNGWLLQERGHPARAATTSP